ncbi:hypothetical protein STHU_09690 [Allostella humosa]|nr:hypothetical protein STHU_09690 [Stella humosa]
MIHVACSRCPRRGRYQRDRIIERYGSHTPMDLLLSEMVGACPQGQECGAHFLAPARWDPARPSMTVAGLAADLRRYDPSLPVIVTGRDLGNARMLRVACLGERPRRLYNYGRPYLLICADD